MTALSFVDVSGVGNSGKSAVVDLLREIDRVWVPEYWFEFDLLRVPGGVLDLRGHVVSDWSPIRSHDAVHAFRDVVRKMGCNPAWWDVAGLLTSTSQRYDRRFRGQFIAASEAFVESLVVGRYRAEWPFDGLRQRSSVRFARKVLRRMGFRKQLLREVLLVDGRGFDERASAYLDGLYRRIIPPDADRVVMNNGFEPFHPIPALDMLAGAKQIVVTRDPRDMYVSGLNAHKVGAADRGLLAFDNDGMNKSFLASDDIELFIRRYALYARQLYRGPDRRVLRLRFEDLVRDPAPAVARIFGFLEIDPARHARAGTCFRPDQSAKNVGLWRQYSRQDEIRAIGARLGEHLVDR
jgi:hypothetical protein